MTPPTTPRLPSVPSSPASHCNVQSTSQGHTHFTDLSQQNAKHAHANAIRKFQFQFPNSGVNEKVCDVHFFLKLLLE